MNRKYVIGICITFIVLSINQTYIQYSLRLKKDDAETINIAGKQRMLSQKINTFSYLNSDKETYFNALETTFKEWKNSHYTLKEKFNNSKNTFDNNIYYKFTRLDKHIVFVEKFISNRNFSQSQLKLLLNNQQEYLVKMDNIVFDLQQDSNTKLNHIVLIEYLLFAISLLILFLEVFLIYKPISNKEKLNNLLLTIKNKELNSALNDVEIKKNTLEKYMYLASHELKEPIKNIYALADLISTQIDPKKNELTSELLNHLKSKTTDVNNSIKMLMDYYNVGTNLLFEEIDLNSVFNELKANLKDDHENNNISIVAEKLPTIVGLKEEIKILLFHIIGNALKFRNQNLATILSLHYEEEEKFWCFWLESNNIRLSNKSLQKLFSHIKKPSQENSYSGIGISIALFEKITKLHNGKSWVGTTDKNLTKFYFTISKKIKTNV